MLKDQTLPAKLASCELSAQHLILPDNTNYEEWRGIGAFLKRTEGAIQFWIGDWLRFGERKYGEKYKDALVELGYEYQTLRDFKYVADKVELSRRRDNLDFSHHREVASLPAPEQDIWLQRAEQENLTRNELRRQIQESKRQPTPPLPEATFDVIYADPPWQYDFSETESRAIESHYQTMTLDEICNLRIPSADNAVLFLWATAPKLREALQVMQSWGFEYKTHAVWDKEIIGMGYWFRGRHELLLVGTKGSFAPPPPEARQDSVFRERRTKHSHKPDLIYDLIEHMHPGRSYLELFARVKRKNWKGWGVDYKEQI